MENETRELKLNQNELNSLLIEMIKNQKQNNKNIIKLFIITVICFVVIIVSMIIGFVVYESQFEKEFGIEMGYEEYTRQEVNGENSEINNVDGNMYKDNAIHNEN